MVLEMIRKENEGLINQGRLEGIKEMIIGMLKNNINEKTIKKVARISDKELQEIKEKM